MAAESRPERFHLGSLGSTPEREEGTPSAGSKLSLGSLPAAPEAADPRDRKREREGGPTTSSPPPS
eukprot:5086714-Alexandrium_andersonii.AAC.1